MSNLTWHQLSAGRLAKSLGVDLSDGLSAADARHRLQVHGPNRLQEEARTPPWRILLGQFKDFMVLTLIAATIISFALGEVADGVTILAIVVINGILGFIQEYRAEKSLQGLKQMTAPEAVVIRDGEEKKIAASELVPGDLVRIDAGTRIPADLRLIETVNLEIEESALTGESNPVHKKEETISQPNIALGDRRNMAYLGTTVTRGRGLGMVVGTGMNTELGRIAGMIQEVEEEPTPLQRRLEQLGKVLVLACLLICAVVVVVGVWRGEPLYLMFLTGVSLAVAAIPEGLPAIVTVSLALGVQRMIRRQAIVRKLPAVETLGCTTVICSDKTGTLTQNQMTVRRIFVSGQFLEVSGGGYDPRGFFSNHEGEIKPGSDPTLGQLLKISALCNNATLYQEKAASYLGRLRGALKNGDSWTITGDPTEGALLVAAAKGGLWRRDLEKVEKRTAEIPFESERKRMSVVCRESPGRANVYVKGAADVILDRCSRVLVKGKVVKMGIKEKNDILSANNRMAGEALRVLGTAYRPLSAAESLEPDHLESDLIFVGLAGMIDPPRPAVKKAAQTARQAGIRTIMITGDHPATAFAIAIELGLASSMDEVITGVALDSMTDQELAARVDQVQVFARVSPAHKVRIVRALKKRDEIVAMTGDGVNDAPAVKEADIGISMGRTGTDVTKEASSMVLADDNYSTIVAAIEEGRAIYDNIRKFIRYLLGCNIGEVLCMFFAPLMGLPLPLIPLQILWVNLVTDGLPALALGVDPADKDIMQRQPRPPRESVFARGLGRKVVIRGLEITLGTLLVFVLARHLYRDTPDPLVTARTMAFCTLVFLQLFFVFQCRSETRSEFAKGFFSNPYLVLAVIISTSMQLAVVYLPALRPFFHTTPLEVSQWAIVLGVAGAHTFGNLVRHLFLRRADRRPVLFRPGSSA
ncbi:MAG: calcium-transporting P-type ATPase, PMR1-type [Firmicutes bacterium]|nr:calcium-transporting P-type ATPase, PMR1-type [Bacillota bacterium]